MRIKYLPSSPTAGQVEHIANSVGETLIAAGFAEEIKYRDFRERLAAEASPAAPPLKVEWGVQERHLSRFGLVVVIKKVGAETQYLSAPPDDAPESIKKRFAELNQPPLDPEVAQEHLVQEAYRQDAQHKAENAASRGIVFGRK